MKQLQGEQSGAVEAAKEYANNSSNKAMTIYYREKLAFIAGWQASLNQSVKQGQAEECPTCGAPCEMSWSGLELVANTGDETLASKHYHYIHASPSQQTAGAVEALELLYEAVPKQTNDADWWSDELTEAMQKAKKVIFESSGDKDSERGEIERLKQWKREAIEVMPDMQAIGKALNIPLGQSIHDKILPGIEELKEDLRKCRAWSGYDDWRETNYAYDDYADTYCKRGSGGKILPFSGGLKEMDIRREFVKLNNL